MKLLGLVLFITHSAAVTASASGLLADRRLNSEVKGKIMSCYFSTRPLFDAVIVLALLSLAKLTRTEENENLYLKTSTHDIPIYSRGIEADELHPRLRRNDFFLKAGKSVPRIGRRNDNRDQSFGLIPQIDTFDQTQTNTGAHQVSRRRNDFLFAKTIPRIGRRDEIESKNMKYGEDNQSFVKKNNGYAPMEGEAVAAWPWFRNPELFSPYQKKIDKNFPSSYSWSDDEYVLGKSTESPSRVKQCLRTLCEINGPTSERIH